jgi:hypothetical protein
MPATDLSRRAFLRGQNALIALPVLESLGWRRFASAKPAKTPPKRMVFLGFGWGVTRESWSPKRSDTGADYALPPGLAELKRHKSDITIIQGLVNKFNNEAHWGSTFYLTGANRYAEPGQSFSNTVSADQLAAGVFGRDTRFTSVQLGCKAAENDGHGPGLSMAWNRQGKPIAGFNNPVVAFHRLFSHDDTPLAQRQAMLSQRRSVLDAVSNDAKRVGKDLSATDSDKLGEYLQSIRDIETRLGKEEQWLDVPKRQPANPVPKPSGDVAGFEEVKLMYKLMLAAMQVDASRVFTYRQPVTSFIQSLGANITGHNMSHYTSGVRREVSEMRDRKQTELFAGFIDDLKASRESDGSRLYDHVCLSYGSNIHSIHYLNNCPAIITGGGAGIAHGRHIALDAARIPLCNLWLTLLRGVGLDVESHGDSTGVLRELT